MTTVKAHTRKTKKGQVRVKAHARHYEKIYGYGVDSKGKYGKIQVGQTEITPERYLKLDEANRFTDVGDTYALVDDIKHEIKPILDFLEIHYIGKGIQVGLKRDIPFKQFANYFPEISRKDLTKLFDYLEANPREVKEAIKELTKK